MAKIILFFLEWQRLDDNHERTLYLKPGEHYFTPSGKGHSISNEQDEDLGFHGFDYL